MLAACGRIGFTSGELQSSTDGAGPNGDGMAPTDGLPTDGIGVSAWAAQAPAPNTVHDLWGIHAFAADDLWISGNVGTLMHFDGNAWTTTPNAATDSVFVVWGADPNDVWAVGKGCLA